MCPISNLADAGLGSHHVRYGDCSFGESSPDELASYRAMYAEFMEMEFERKTGGPTATTRLGTTPKQEVDLTRRSLVMRSLNLAADSPMTTIEIVRHIHKQINQLTALEWDNVGLHDDSSDTKSLTSRGSEDSEDSNETEATDLVDETAEEARDEASNIQSRGDFVKMDELLSDTLANVNDHLKTSFSSQHDMPGAVQPEERLLETVSRHELTPQSNVAGTQKTITSSRKVRVARYLLRLGRKRLEGDSPRSTL